MTDHTMAGPVVGGGVKTGGWTGWQPAISNKKEPPSSEDDSFDIPVFSLILILKLFDFPCVFDVAFGVAG